MAIYNKETETKTDSQGNITIKTTEKEIYSETEPDYIKIYTAMFFEFKQFPQQYRELFLQLAMRMSYSNSMKPDKSQIVYVTGPNRDEIMEVCGWKNVCSLSRGLKVLCDCGAIRKINRTVYQINPEFAGRGHWRYNAKLEQGGIKDITAYFKFASNSVDTQIDFIDIDEDGNQISYEERKE